jgi:hypothetical protein
MVLVFDSCCLGFEAGLLVMYAKNAIILFTMFRLVHILPDVMIPDICSGCPGDFHIGLLWHSTMH